MWIKLNSQGEIEGVNASFKCLLVETNTAVNVTRWEFNGQQPNQTDSRITIQPPQTKHELEIESVNPSDTGIYVCIADVHGVLVNSSIHFKVHCKL